MEQLKEKIKNFSELVMFEHTIFSASFIFIAMVSTNDDKKFVRQNSTKKLLACC